MNLFLVLVFSSLAAFAQEDMEPVDRYLETIEGEKISCDEGVEFADNFVRCNSLLFKKGKFFHQKNVAKIVFGSTTFENLPITSDGEKRRLHQIFFDGPRYRLTLYRSKPYTYEFFVFTNNNDLITHAGPPEDAESTEKLLLMVRRWFPNEIELFEYVSDFISKPR